MKIKFNFYDDLPRQKMLELHSMVIFLDLLFMRTVNITGKFSSMNVCITYKYYLKKVQISNTKILYYDRIDVSEGIVVNKTST